MADIFILKDQYKVQDVEITILYPLMQVFKRLNPDLYVQVSETGMPINVTPPKWVRRGNVLYKK